MINMHEISNFGLALAILKSVGMSDICHILKANKKQVFNSLNTLSVPNEPPRHQNRRILKKRVCFISVCDHCRLHHATA